jgi:hypothetical protein
VTELEEHRKGYNPSAKLPTDAPGVLKMIHALDQISPEIAPVRKLLLEDDGDPSSLMYKPIEGRLADIEKGGSADKAQLLRGRQ